ncbi:MAG: aminotransferase class I/II-fold pyridoxal phosphate-dependent enzyme, partial [Ilumatobacter sp.]|nr:aminotransferase class I/II-fold pyridoxal phosphate-dependent enzyme [Ilumatobacter sp.]
MSIDTTTPARTWLSEPAVAREREILDRLDLVNRSGVDRRIHDLVERSSEIHDRECINLNPASNVMNPRAEALLATGLTTRASLGHPGDKYETGLEAIEEIEVMAAAAARELFGARHAEVRVGSGAMANLYTFMATCAPGDAIIAPPPSIGGHVTHHRAGAAGLYGLDVHHVDVDAAAFTVDLDALDRLAAEVRPKLITIGTSLNLLPHPVREIREIADRYGALVLFDAAHACGMIAGGVWPNPLDEGAHLMTMSTYKSLGGPAGGLVFTNDDALAERIDAIAYPGLTANFDVAKTAALAITLLDWLECGEDYAAMMLANSVALADALQRLDLPVFTTGSGPTASHQLVVDATEWGGGHPAALRLREGNLLACAIGLPGFEPGAGLRLGTPEVTRIGMTPDHMPELAGLIAGALRGEAVDAATSALRQRFPGIHYVREGGSGDLPVTPRSSASPPTPDPRRAGGCRLSGEEMEAFGRDGVVVLPARFSLDEVAAINDVLDRLMEEDVPENIREKSSGVVRTAMGLHLRHELFARLVNDPRFLEPAAQILGDVPVYAQQVKVNAKAAFTGEQWQWHYDFATHHHEDGVPEPLALNMHIFLDDVTEFNGPLMFVRGSH